jgi:hypothetical protein
MRRLLATVAVIAFAAACTPPAQQQTDRPNAPSGPQVQACNEVAPDARRQIGIDDETIVAAAASDLRGGAITPGTYDLTRAMRVGQATGWRGTQAVALAVSEDPSGGVTFNWAGQPAGGDTDRWTANFTDTPQPRLSYTCGRMGEVAAEFSAVGDTLTLRLPDGANGQLSMDFQRRL